MNFYPLYETAPGAGTYQLGSVLIVAASTSAAVAVAAQSAPEGCRTGVWPYKAVAGLPDSVPPAEGESGQMYDVLAEPEGPTGTFSRSGQVFGSFGADASGMALSLERFFGYRLGLIPQGAKPAPAATPAPASSSGTTSAATPSGSGTTVSSGGSATPAG
ncbi:hypothetical protein [Acetobacter orleanensis]|uniref:Uncharacterized protein n=1 Tax=Acetobacter orleanensis TaxID=104099 RepID=A0A4Y3TQY4_9PROT|nr:hypothetical protein [Acetobacter orleanensis]KXV62547.1 hypothetical protein AD949_10555 [Acetobacter orleanensis]PCD80013.1 hypothetical protein CO710_03920 [Acetobacter orleanensis]GAN68327.1 hypothetical protein Abol_015_166 [Acetobacter orleanensis JCM 7639]GBR29828.1 hypothetical protein AA0473_2121 [Acetobacter orleanensis NRIC 0473]GEB83859.1 hypothetical protein AOR01nite_23360 [Acetobacter orleanensis]